MNASELRQRMRVVCREIQRQAKTLMEQKVFLQGGVYRLRRRCGKTGCRCARGVLHESWVLLRRQKGEQRMRAVPRGQEARWRTLAEHYRRFRRARVELGRQCRELQRLAGELQRARTVAPPRG